MINLGNSKPHRLYWLCSRTGHRVSAGVAFYNEDKSDYRLCIDTFCENKTVYLKPVSMADNVIYFRVEAVTRRGGDIFHRAEIGTGHADLESGYPVYMDIGPFEKTLVLEAVA